MQDLHRALADISAIRGQMARGTVFRGYGPAALAATGVLALLAAVVQARWIDDPLRDITAYLALWIATAARVDRDRRQRGDPPLAPRPFRPRRRHDPGRRRAVPARRDRRRAPDVRASCASRREPVDAARPLADRVQPRRVRVVPLAAAADDRDRGLVPRDRPRLPRFCQRRACAVALGDGRAVRWSARCSRPCCCSKAMEAAMAKR